MLLDSRRMRRRIVGTAGHIDHGKSTLVRALTGIDTDRLPEEKKRGITIDLGFANLVEADLQIGFVDVPGHERFVKNMLAGIGGIDAALLVVAADESIKPQTREHFQICRLLHIPTGVVAITKTDLVDGDFVEIVRLEVAEMTRGSFLEGSPVIGVSATDGRGLEELRRALVDVVGSVPDRVPSGKIFRMPIDRVFSMQGFGTIVTGTAIAGEIAADAPLVVHPEGLVTRARNIQVHGEPRDRAVAGERTSINLADLQVADLGRGQQLTPPDTLAPTQILTASIELLPDAPALKEGARVRVHLHSAELLATVRILADFASLLPGGKAYVQLRLETPVIAVRGDRFILRRYSPLQTIGGGLILAPHVGKLHRRTRQELLDGLASESLLAQLAGLARLAGMNGVSFSELQRHTGASTAALSADVRSGGELVQIGTSRNRRWIDPSAIRELRTRAMTIVREYFNSETLTTGLPKSELLQKLLPPSADNVMAQFVLDDLVSEKIIVLQGDRIDMPGRSGDLRGVEGELARLLEKSFLDAGLKPPPVSELIKATSQRPKVVEGVISFLVRKGTIIRLGEGIYIHPATVEAAAATMREHRGETIDVGWFKEKFSLSRKIAIPLLEYLDRAGVTRRTGDQRQVL